MKKELIKTMAICAAAVESGNGSNMDTLPAFDQRCMDVAMSAFNSERSLDGTTLLFAETDDVANNALWGLRFEEDDHKRQMLLMASCALNYRKTKRYAVMALAWLSSDAHPKPSEDPNRKEVMMVAIAELSGETRMYLRDVQRDVTGGISDITDKDPRTVRQPGLQHKGPMLELLMNNEDVPPSLGLIADMWLASSLLSGTTLNNPAASAGR